ncbi:MAG: VOC family protein [Candidatus Korobacteraceae bacterium]
MALPLRLHHVGFVVANIQTAMPGFQRSLAAEWDGQIFHDPLQKVRVAFLTTRAQDPAIELVEPAGDDSPVLRFFQERGGGLHHVCYEVADLEEELAAFRSRGALIAKRPLPAVAFGGRRIAWVITSEKLLVELLEQATRD